MKNILSMSLGTALVASLLVGVRAEESAPSARDLEKGLARVDSLCRREKCKAGLKALQALLKTHEQQPHARAKRAEISDLTLRLAFGSQVKRPKPQSLISGTIKKWDPKTGKIKLVYTPKNAADLEADDGMFWHPARFCGPVVLQIEGAMFDGRNPTKGSPLIIFGGDDHPSTGERQSWQVSFGYPPRTEGANEVWLPFSITHRDGDARKKVAEKEISPTKYGSYKASVRVDKSRILVSVNGRKIATCKKPKGVWGSFGFEAPRWKKSTFSGIIESSWLQSKLDAVSQRQLNAFKRTYDRGDYLPAWLFESASPARTAEPRDTESLPAALSDEHIESLTKFYEALASENYDRALGTIDKIQTAGAPESTCAYLRALVFAWRGDHGAAMEGVSKTIELAPDFVGARVLQIRLLHRMGQDDDILAAFEATVARFPNNPKIYEVAALTMLYAGHMDHAQRICSMAAAKGLASERLTLLESALVRATRGPTWSKRFEHKSRNYHVLSDIDKKTCLASAKVLEEAFTAYRVHLTWVPRKKTQLFKVFLFRGRAGFMGYQEDLGPLMGKPSEKAAGLYSPLLKQLLIWNLPSRKDMMETIRHEGFHQYLDRLMPDPPVWFNEGLAVYHENPKKVSGQLRFGQLQHTYLNLVDEGDIVPCRDFLYYGSRKFYEASHRSYAQAWALVHMLRHGEKRYRLVFKKLIAELQAGTESNKVLKTAFPDASMDQLDADLNAYIASLATK